MKDKAVEFLRSKGLLGTKSTQFIIKLSDDKNGDTEFELTELLTEFLDYGKTPRQIQEASEQTYRPLKDERGTPPQGDDSDTNNHKPNTIEELIRAAQATNSVTVVSFGVKTGLWLIEYKSSLDLKPDIVKTDDLFQTLKTI